MTSKVNAMPAGSRRVAGALALAAIALASVLAASVGLAHITYVYNANVNFATPTLSSAPVVWLAGSNYKQVQLSLTNKSNPVVSLTIPVTNSTEIYVYQALELKVNNAFGTNTPYLNVTSCSFTATVSGFSIKNVTIVVYPTTGSPTSPTGTIVLYPSTTGCKVSGSVALSQGTTYYVDFEVFPSLPLPYAAAGTSLGSLTLYFIVGNGSATTVGAP